MLITDEFKLPRKRRSVGAPALHLTEQDIAILHTVHHYSLLLRRQIETLLAPYYPSFYLSEDILERLYQSAYLERVLRPTYSHEEPKEPAYRLGSEGGRLLASVTETPLSSFYYWGKGDDKDRRKTEVRVSFVDHELENADLRIVFEQSAIRNGCTWELWQDGFELRRSRGWARIPVELSEGKHEDVTIFPDDVCILQSPHGRGYFIIEHDRSSETGIRSWRRKILAYKEFVRSRQFHERFGITGAETPLRILTTTLSPTRAQNLKTAAETYGSPDIAPLFLFATLNRLNRK
jgi:hypothetical protein